MRMLIHYAIGVCLYALVILTIGALAVRLGSHVVTEAVVLALPYAAHTATKRPSLVEQRRSAVAQAQPRRGRSIRKIAALKPPSASAGALAASLDVAEAPDLPPPPHGVTVPPLALAHPLSFDTTADIRHNQKRIKSAQLRSSGHARKRRPSAADEFNRRFGVLVAGPQMADAR